MILTGGVEQSAGIGFAIPINTAKAVLDDLVHLGRARYPSLGVRTLPIGPQLADDLGLAADSGLLIVQVIEWQCRRSCWTSGRIRTRLYRQHAH